MKKTLRTILAGAVALLAVSCYDDTKVLEEIGKLDDRVTAIENTINAEVGGINDLASRLAAAEGKISTVEGALNAEQSGILARLDAIDGSADGKIKNLEDAIAKLVEADKAFDTELADAVAKIAIIKVEEVDGNWKLTPASGDPIFLSKPLSNVENTGLVTVVTEDDVKYWATVGADGTATSLGVPVGHPDYKIAFQVTTDGKLTYTINDGEPVETGVTTADLTGQKYLINDVAVAEDGKTVAITIGDAEYVLPMYIVDNSTIIIKAGKTTFGYGETKEFALEVKDITKYYVMTKPDGWKVVLDGKTLTVTAPTEEAVGSYAEADGEVLLHANTADGKCKVAKLGVATTLGLTIAIDEETGMLTVKNALTAQMSGWHPLNGQYSYFGFRQIQIGFATIELFEKDPEAYISAYNNEELPYSEKWGGLGNVYGNVTQEQEPEYVEGECEVAEYNMQLSEAYRFLHSYNELMPGTKFILWAAPLNDDGWTIDASQLTYLYYAPITGKVELVESKADDIDVKVSLYGADAYYVGKIAHNMAVDNMTGECSIEAYLNEAIKYMDMMAGYGQNMNILGKYIEEDGEYSLSLKSVLHDQEQEAPLSVATDYYVYVVPVVEGKALSEYDYAKDIAPYVYTLSTKNLEAGGTAGVSLELAETDFYNICVNITPDAKAKSVYYKFYGEDDGEITPADVIETGFVSVVDEYTTVIEARQATIEPGQEYTLAVVAVDADYKYGEPVVGTFSSTALKYSKTVTAAFGTPTSQPHSNGSGLVYSIPVTVTGGEPVKYYYQAGKETIDESKVDKLPLGFEAGIYYMTTKEADGSLPIPYAAYGSTQNVYLTVELADGTFTPVIELTINVPAGE